MALCEDDGCEAVTLTEPENCYPAWAWEQIAIKHCWENFGTLEYTNFAAGDACEGGFTGASFSCCGGEEEEETEEEICCLTENGPDVVDAGTCTEDLTLTMAACEQYDAIQEVCCLVDDAPLLTTANICAEDALLPMAQCESDDEVPELEEDKKGADKKDADKKNATKKGVSKKK